LTGGFWPPFVVLMSKQVYTLRALRAIRANRASHASAGVGLLMLGLEGLGGEHGQLRPILEILAGGLLFAVVAFESIQDKRGKHHDSTYEIADFFAAFVAVVEGIGRIHHDSFWSSRLTFAWWAVALMFIAKGVFGPKVRVFNTITVTDKEFVYRRPFRKRKRVAWTDVTGFQIADSVLVIERAVGDAIRIDLRKYEKPDKISDWCRTEIPKVWQEPDSKLK
jgi:hypothetical protein